VFDESNYAGDARIEDLQPGESRLLSYAVDLGTEVKPETKDAPETLLTVKAAKGILTTTHKLRHTSLYTIKNRSEQTRKVVIEHPLQSDWKLVQPEKAGETTRDVYRFEMPVEPNKPVKFEVVEEQRRQTEVQLVSLNDDALRFYARAAQSSEGVKAGLQKALDLRAQLADSRRLIQKEEAAMAVIEKDQARMRANMERLPKETDAYKRYVKTFDEQETELRQHRDKVDKLQEKVEAQTKALEEFILGLDID
jgi:hypothetical protein